MISHEHNIDYAARQVPAKVRSVEAPGAAPTAQELGSHVVPWAVEQQSYEGPTAEASNTRQSCIKKLERPPHDVQSKMIEPTRTEIQTTGTYWDAPGCNNLKGSGQHRAQLKVKGHWIGIEGDGWYSAANSNGHSFNLLDLATRGVKEKKVNGHWEPAREQFRVVVRDPRTGKIISTGKIKNFPVKIEG
jgi:hypothetical protein